jgi:hypothetical protein
VRSRLVALATALDLFEQIKSGESLLRLQTF